MTARTSSIRASRSGTPGGRSDMPVPRLSKRISRPIAASRSRKRAWRRLAPVHLEVREEAGHEDEVDRAVAGHLVGDAQVAAAGVADRRGRGGGGAPRGLPAEEGGGLAQVGCVEALLEAAVGPRHEALGLARAARVAQEPPQAQGRPQLEGAPALSAGDVERPPRRGLGLLVVAERPQRLGAQPVELGVVEEPAAAGHVVEGLAQDVEGLGGLARADERVGEQPQEVGVLHPAPVLRASSIPRRSSAIPSSAGPRAAIAHPRRIVPIAAR